MNAHKGGARAAFGAHKQSGKLITLLALAFSTAAAVAEEPSMFDKLKESAAEAADKIGTATNRAADAVGGAVNQAVERANETVETTKQDLGDSATPQETRAKLDAMAERTLERLFAQRPAARELFEASAGYAVFDTRQVELVVAAGYGRGVAVDRATDERTYMKMGTGGVGIGFGLGGFDTQIVIFFENAFSFQKFVTQGLDATAEAGTITGDSSDQIALRFDDGRAVFVLTKEGWKLSAKLAGTKYWPDKALNAPEPDSPNGSQNSGPNSNPAGSPAISPSGDPEPAD
jgi:lipid-binding SYLF domain-containing protein